MTPMMSAAERCPGDPWLTVRRTKKMREVFSRSEKRLPAQEPAKRQERHDQGKDRKSFAGPQKYLAIFDQLDCIHGIVTSGRGSSGKYPARIHTWSDPGSPAGKEW